MTAISQKDTPKSNVTVNCEMADVGQTPIQETRLLIAAVNSIPVLLPTISRLTKANQTGNVQIGANWERMSHDVSGFRHGLKCHTLSCTQAESVRVIVE